LIDLIVIAHSCANGFKPISLNGNIRMDLMLIRPTYYLFNQMRFLNKLKTYRQKERL